MRDTVGHSRYLRALKIDRILAESVREGTRKICQREGRAMRILILLAVVLLLGSAEASAVTLTTPDGKEAKVCGGFAGLECDKGEWCDFPDGATCGMADQFGTCRKSPDVCPAIYLPVCGCDGTTYGNACEAAAAGFDVGHTGECKERPSGG